MAVGTKSGSGILAHGGALQVFSATSAADTTQTVSTDTEGPYRLLFTTIAYSAAPTAAAATVTLNSEVGAGFDTTLATGQANTRYVVYIPDGELIIARGDAIDVTAPQAGGVITSSVAIYVVSL